MLDIVNNLSYIKDKRTRDLLIESAPLALEWSKTECFSKDTGGMEEWAKENKPTEAECCGWYHGTWQMLRLLDMVAVPPWYPFYVGELGKILREKPNANVFISAAADWGMLATLHEAIESVGANPKITIYDICQTPLRLTQWYADKYNLKIESHCDNIISSKDIPLGSYDLIVTDEFLTVLRDDYKPMITKRWLELLAPGGSVVTTAMVGAPTTPELRIGYYERAKRLLERNAVFFEKMPVSKDELLEQFRTFANLHTRHMMTSEYQLENLFKDYLLDYTAVVTPGECINPTTSFQIVAKKIA